MALWTGNPAVLINSVHMRINAKNSKVVPFVERGKACLPVNFVARSLGAPTVSCDAVMTVVTITLEERIEDVRYVLVASSGGPEGIS